MFLSFLLKFFMGSTKVFRHIFVLKLPNHKLDDEVHFFTIYICNKALA